MEITHRNLVAHDIASTRIKEATAMTIIMAMATSPDADPPAASELVSLALDGVRALPEQASNALGDINPVQQVA